MHWQHWLALTLILLNLAFTGGHVHPLIAHRRRRISIEQAPALAVIREIRQRQARAADPELDYLRQLQREDPSEKTIRAKGTDPALRRPEYDQLRAMDLQEIAQ